MTSEYLISPILRNPNPSLTKWSYINMECDIDKNDSFEEVYHKVRKRKENYERKIN